jgi:hypothetical protein
VASALGWKEEEEAGCFLLALWPWPSHSLSLDFRPLLLEKKERMNWARGGSDVLVWGLGRKGRRVSVFPSQLEDLGRGPKGLLPLTGGNCLS